MKTSVASSQTTKNKSFLRITGNKNVNQITRKGLLICGILSSFLYVIMNIVTAVLYEGYNSVSQTVSELSAIDAPTRPLWLLLAFVYSLLVIAFAWGVHKSAMENRSLRVVAALLFANGVIGFFWPPMHQREVLATGGGTITDTMHIVFTLVTVPLMMLVIAFGATAFGKRFRQYSIATVVILIFAGVLTGLDSPNISKDLPTPWIGVWERINIGVYMLWIVVLTLVLLKRTTYQVKLIKID